MTHQRKLISGALAAALASAIQTGPVFGETLQDALVAAYNSNPTLLAERARLRATDEGVSQAVAGWRPTVTVTADYGVNETRSQFSRSFFGTNLATSTTSKTYTRDYSASLTATQPLFRGFQTVNSTKQAKAEVREGRALLWSVEQQVLLDAITAYVDVIRDEATLALNLNNGEVLGRQLEAAQDRFRVGEITRTDVAQSEARLSLARSNITRAEATLAATRARYEAVIGQAPGSLVEPPVLPPLPGSLEDAISAAVDNNPGLVAAKENEDAAKHNVDVTKGALLPTAQVRAQFNTNEEIPRKNTQRQTYNVAAELTVPIYQSGAEYSRIRQPKHAYNQPRIQGAETRRDIVQSVTTSYENLLAARSTIVSGREQVRANEIAFEGVQQEAQVGSRTTLDVLDAEQELLDSREALIRAERDEQVAAYQLLASIGELTAANLGLPVDLYDPEEHYRAVNTKWIGWDTPGD